MALDREPVSTRPSPSRLPDAIREAAERLTHGALGILLVGSSVQTSTAVGDLLAHARAKIGNRLQPVRFQAGTGTPDLLRDVVGRAHEARPSPDTRLLIVVAQADALSPEVLQEFELAAEAASMHGGLQFLFTSSEDVSLIWRREKLIELSGSFGAPLRLTAETGEPGLLATYGAQGAPVATEPWQAETPPRGLGLRILVAILAVVALAALIVTGVGYRRQVPLSNLSSRVTASRTVPPPPAWVPPVKLPSDDVPAARTVPRPSPPAPVVAKPVTIPQVEAPPVQPAIRLSVPAPGAPLAAAPVASMAATEIPAPAPPTVAIPGASLLLIAEPGDTLPRLYAKVYQGMTPPPYPEVAAVNPATIKPGDHLMFPTPPGGWRP